MNDVINVIRKDAYSIQFQINERKKFETKVCYSTSPKFEDHLSYQLISFDNGISNIIKDRGEERIFYQFIENSITYVGSEKRIPISLHNLRDLGGLKTKDNHLVRWGSLYRSDALINLNQDDLNYLYSMDIDTVIDLRSKSEIKTFEDRYIGENIHLNLSINADAAKKASSTKSTYENDRLKINKLEQIYDSGHGQKKLQDMKKMMELQMKEFVKNKRFESVFTTFLKALVNTNGPVIYHCQGGKDRTGWATALILIILNVDVPIIIDDYLLTKEFNQYKNELRMKEYRALTDNNYILEFLSSLQDTKKSYINSAFSELFSNYHDPLDYIRQELLLTQNDINLLRNKYLYKN